MGVVFRGCVCRLVCSSVCRGVYVGVVYVELCV